MSCTPNCTPSDTEAYTATTNVTSELCDHCLENLELVGWRSCTNHQAANKKSIVVDDDVEKLPPLFSAEVPAAVSHAAAPATRPESSAPYGNNVANDGTQTVVAQIEQQQLQQRMMGAALYLAVSSASPTHSQNLSHPPAAHGLAAALAKRLQLRVATGSIQADLFGPLLSVADVVPNKVTLAVVPEDDDVASEVLPLPLPSSKAAMKRRRPKQKQLPASTGIHEPQSERLLPPLPSNQQHGQGSVAHSLGPSSPSPNMPHGRESPIQPFGLNVTNDIADQSSSTTLPMTGSGYSDFCNYAAPPQRPQPPLLRPTTLSLMTQKLHLAAEVRGSLQLGLEYWPESAQQ